MEKKSIVIVLGIITLLVASFLLSRGRGEETDRETGGKLRVAASFYPFYFLASELGGERIEAVNMTPAGAEPHDYELSPRDIALIEQSRLLLLSGGGLESWGADVAQERAMGSVVYVEEGLMNRMLEEDGKVSADPHAWLDPKLYGLMADRVADALVAADPAGADHYRNRQAELKTRLDGLDAAYRAGLETCDRREFVTSHDAFGYLALAYGLQQVALAGLSPDAEPTPKYLAEVAEFARAHDVRYIFFESLVNPELARTLAEEVGAETLTLNPLEGVSDEELALGRDYFSEMEGNLAQLRLALGCR